MISLEKKNTKLDFWAKNYPQMNGFAVVKKAPNHWEIFFLKKNSSSLFVQIKSSKRYEQFLKK